MGSGLVNPERLLAELREELEESAARDHWHGPDGPCLKCGGTDGMKPQRRVIAISHSTAPASDRWR